MIVIKLLTLKYMCFDFFLCCRWYSKKAQLTKKTLFEITNIMSNSSIAELYSESVNSSSSTLHCRIQYLDDTDPFSSVNLPEPARPPSFTFLTSTVLSNQLNSVQ